MPVKQKAVLVGIGERGVNDIKIMLRDAQPGDVIVMRFSGPSAKVKVNSSVCAPFDFKWSGPSGVRVKANKKNAKNKIHRKDV